MAVWPGTPVEVPAVVVPDELLLNGGLLEIRHTNQRRRLPDEFFLRELIDLDVNDDAAVVQLMLTHGVAAEPDLGHVNGLHLGDARKDFAALPDDTALVQPFPLTISRWTLLYLRAIVRFWVMAKAGDDPQDGWKVDGLPLPTAYDPWPVWARLLSGFLEPFHVRVTLDPSDEPWIMLQHAVALQLANAVSGETDLRRCHNEPCARWFSRQRGGAVYSSRKRGVIYCTPSCARAQVERERRRRTKESS